MLFMVLHGLIDYEKIWDNEMRKLQVATLTPMGQGVHVRGNITYTYYMDTDEESFMDDLI